MREALAAEFDLPRLEVAARQKSVDGTEKFLFRLRRQRGHRDRRDSRGRSRDVVHLVAGRLRASVRVLRDGCDGFQPQPHAVRDRRTGSRDASARSAHPVTNIVFMGMGEPLMNWKAVDAALTILNDPAGPRHRRAAHHHLDGRRASRNRRARRASGAVPPRDLDSRAERRAASRADADQHEVSARRRDRGGESVRPSRHVRVRDARRRERRVEEHAIQLAQLAQRMPRLREPHSAAPGRRARLHADVRRSHSHISRESFATRRRRSGGAKEPRRRHRRGVRTATGRTARAGGRQVAPSTTAISR